MKSKSKILIWSVVSIVLICVIVTGIYIYKFNTPDTGLNDNTQTTSNNDSTKVINWDQVQNRIDILKKRLSFKWLIQDGDIHFQNEEYTRALAKFLQVHKQNPSDESIIKKIWDIYFQLNKYPQAYKYYSKIKAYNQLDLDQVIQTLFYSEDIKLDNIWYLSWELATYNLSNEQNFYYTNSLTCVRDYHTCRKNFHDYFDLNMQNVDSWSWEIVLSSSIQLPELQNIQSAIQNYENFQLDDLSYKAALISWAYFQNKLYPIAIATSKDTLKNSPDYRPLIKIIAKSYYEMWDYINAKKFLIQYNGLWDNEPEISYFLWIIHQKLKEYTRSTIQLRKSIQLWYSWDLDVKRRLLFNYYQLWDTDKMLWVFQEMVRDNINEISVEDMSLAIFYHILNEQIEKANIFTSFALKKFPDSEVFYGYHGWLILQSPEFNNDTLIKADEILKKGLAINDKNPMISLTLWQLEEKRGNIEKAFVYYKQTISLDKWGEYEKFAKQKLETLELNK